MNIEQFNEKSLQICSERVNSEQRHCCLWIIFYLIFADFLVKVCGFKAKVLSLPQYIQEI